MKKLFVILLCCAGLTSCFRTKLYVGSARPGEPAVKVSQESFNNHFIGGLVAGSDATMQTQEYAGDAENFVVKTNMSFANCLVSGLTMGIYTPTQTVYYLSYDEFKKNANPEK